MVSSEGGAPLPPSPGSASAAPLQLRLQSYAKVAPGGTAPLRPGSAPGGMPSLSPARIAPFASRPCSAGGDNHGGGGRQARGGEQGRLASISSASEVSGGAIIAPCFSSAPLRPLETEETAAVELQAGAESGPSGTPQPDVAKKGDRGDGLEVGRKAPCWVQLFAAHTLVAFCLALGGRDGRGGEGSGGGGGGDGDDGLGVRKSAGKSRAARSRTAAAAAPTQAVHLGCASLLFSLTALLTLRWARHESVVFSGVFTGEAVSTRALMEPLALIMPACATLAALLVARLAFRCASPRSAPQQAAAWAAQLGGCGACAYQALQLRLLLRLNTAQEQVAVLQWLVACAVQWVVLEPALALLLSLTSCISTRLLALPEQDEMAAQFQGRHPSTRGIAPRRAGATG